MYAILLVVALIWMIPYIWTVRTSFSEGVNIFSSTLELVPRTLTLDNFVQVFWRIVLPMSTPAIAAMTTLVLLAPTMHSCGRSSSSTDRT